MPKFPIGVDNFRKLIEEGYLFVDHTLMMREFIEEGNEISLILRPRRWGKSLTLSMLYYFLAIQETNTKKLFSGLKIAGFDQGAFVQQYQGQYPVILLSLKDIKKDTFDGFLKALWNIVNELYLSHQYLLKSEKLILAEKEMFNLYLPHSANKSEDELVRAIKRLSDLLYGHFAKSVYILIDEYDTPMNFAFHNPTELEKITRFMKVMLGSALKGNDFLQKGLMTGILQLSKNSMLSDLNNLKVYSALDTKYSDYYGFSEEDVNGLFHKCDLTHQAREIKDWYNGYYSGARVVYNPWSIVNCLAEKGAMKPYWVLTSSDELIKHAFIHSGVEVKEQFSQLLLGEAIAGLIESTTKFEELETSSKALWTLLFYAGYLKASNRQLVGLDESCQLAIPNEEVKYVYQSIFQEWLERKMGDVKYQSLLSHLAQGDVESFIKYLNEFLLQSASFRDFTKESDYHCFVLGLVSGMMHRYQVASNKEQGFGFSDITLIPRDKNNRLGLILEFKQMNITRAEPLNAEVKLKAAAESGLQQIADRNYRSIFLCSDYAHVEVVLEIGLAFFGKSVTAAYRKISLKTNESL